MSDILNSAKETFGNAAESIKQSLPDPNAIGTNISQTANTFRETAKSATADFSSQGVMNASKEFLNSNSLIARFVFLILVLIVFLFFLNIGIALVTYFTTPSKTPYLIHGLLPGTSYTIISQDPSSKNPIVYRSNNQNGGIEFTWAFWLKIDNLPTDDKYHNVFVKGNDQYDTNGLATVNNGPGVYLYASPDSNNDKLKQLNLHYEMDVVSPDSTQQLSSQKVDIQNLPIGKWFHVVIRLQNKTMDCYVNGVITNRVSFGDNIPKQNYDNIIYAGNGGFAGSLSNLRYYDYALSVFEINSVVYYGPNLNSASGASSNYFDYLGQRWYSAIPAQ
jgi:hypothetical protein